jgi:hypothetical protein
MVTVVIDITIILVREYSNEVFIPLMYLSNPN